jgi:hypothetical protein
LIASVSWLRFFVTALNVVFQAVCPFHNQNHTENLKRRTIMSQRNNLVRTIEIKDKTGRVIGTRDVVTYAGLLNLAHEEGLKRIETKPLQLPNDDNEHTAVFSAIVETEKGTFISHGDANPENVTERIVPHVIRMAETRAKARALRDAVNIGVVSVEELGLEGNGDPQGDEGDSSGSKNKSDRKAANRQSGDDAPMTDAQRRYIFRLLADEGIEGDEAHEHLKQLLGVASLKDVTKKQASEAIEELSGKRKEAATA